MTRILFVCMGNICRSPLVEAVARTELARTGIAVELASAGTANSHIGEPADPRAIITAEEQGYSLRQHRARQVSVDDFLDYDHILAMDRVNLRALERCCPSSACNKLDLFLRFANIAKPDEVPDPYYGDLRDFEQVLKLARSGVNALAAKFMY